MIVQTESPAPLPESDSQTPIPEKITPPPPKSQAPNTPLIIALSFVVLTLLAVGALVVVNNQRQVTRPLFPKPAPFQGGVPNSLQDQPMRIAQGDRTQIPQHVSITSTQTPTPSPSKGPDAPSTLGTPTKVPTSDGKQYFYYGYPAGQNNKSPKKIIFSLPGHGSTAEKDYAAWKPQLTENGTYALASLNWWDGKGEAPTNYYSPTEALKQIKAFLTSQGYTDSDFVVLFGFSRGSANTYAVKANDAMSPTPIIDAVISASGKYQSDFAMTDAMLNYNSGKPYSGTPWILACGEKDDNPTRDGCIGMNETKTFLIGKGANVLAVLSDPNGTHGAFHQSPLKLAVQALSLLDTTLK